MKKIIEWIGEIEHGKLDIRDNIKWDILVVLRNTLANMRIQIVEEAKKYIGYTSIKYQDPMSWMDEQWFDCSWFVTHILDKFWLAKEEIRHANEYFDSYGIPIHKEVIQPWDLIFFSRDWLIPKHIGIVISSDEYIHAPGKLDTKVEIKKIADELIEKNTPWKIYTQNPIWFKRIVFESPDNAFDINGTNRKRRKKIV